MPIASLALERDPITSQRRRQYPKPPIVEALVDIQVEPSPTYQLSALAALQESESLRYPISEPLMGRRVIQESSTGTTQIQELLGYRLTSSTRGAIVQVRRNGFSFSRLPPYDTWDVWRVEARRVWELFCAAAQPTKVSRLSVRYINRIDIPGSNIELNEFFTTYPEVPAGLPQVVKNFVMRLDIPQPELPNCVLTLSQGGTPAPRAGVVSILLDLDMAQLVDIPADPDPVWERLELLHTRENAVFEECITQHTRELFV